MATRVKLTKLVCPSCGAQNVFTRSEPPHAYRCFTCNVSFIVTNPSYLRTDLQGLTGDKIFYRCIAMVEYSTPEGSRSVQVATFYLNPDCQGITSEEGAAQIATDIINPLRTPGVRVHIAAVPVSRDSICG